MKNLVEINSTELGIKEYNGQRVITFKDIDRVHNRANGTARNAFNRNKKHFVKNEDYFVHEMDEAKRFFNTTAPNGLITITESGYLMIAKVFDDNLSWQVQRQLVNTYFKVKEIANTISDTSQITSAITTLAETMKVLVSNHKETDIYLKIGILQLGIRKCLQNTICYRNILIVREKNYIHQYTRN